MPKLTFLKPSFYKSAAEAIIDSIQHRISCYYYFIGQTTPWSEEADPDVPIDSLKYDREVRNNIVSAKLIRPSDVSYVINRYDWKLDESGNGQVYDQYDDRYDTTICGLDLKYSGTGYIGPSPKIYIGSTGSLPWYPNSVYETNNLIKVTGSNNVSQYYVCKTNGTTGEVVPSHTSGSEYSGTCLLEAISNIDDKNGSGATAELVIENNKIVAVNLTNIGQGYTGKPSITIAGEHTTPAEIEAVIAKSTLQNVQRLEDAKFYVVTNDHRVYKCLDNNNNSLSTVKPVHTTPDFVRYSDGYVWKYLYTITPALKNKFLTKDFMPVATSLQSRFYTDGGIEYVRIEDSGANYSSAKIVVSGDGYLESDPLYIINGVIIEQGTNYNNPLSIEFDKPFNGVGDWVASAMVSRGERYNYNDNIYEVIVSGRLGATPPTHTYGDVSSNTAVLRYVGTTITGSVTAINGQVSDLTIHKKIRSIEIETGGSGYTQAPRIHFNNDTNKTVGKAVVQNGSVVFIEIIDKGEKYTTAPAVVIGEMWTAGQTVTANSQIFYGDALYTVKSNGILGTSAPAASSIGDEITNGTVVLRNVGRAAKATALMQHGAGYSTIPEIIIDGCRSWKINVQASLGEKLYYLNNRYVVVGVLDDVGKAGDTPPIHKTGIETNGSLRLQWQGEQARIALDPLKSEAILYPIISDGKITNVHAVDPGVAYNYATLVVESNEDESENTPDSDRVKKASIVAELYNGNMQIPQVDTELLAVTGEINCIAVTSGGYGYYSDFDPSTGNPISVPPIVTIQGNGTGATAVAVVENGRVVRISVTNPGQNYTQATISLSSPYGHGAAARAIIGPPGGHGKNAVDELFARKLMFFTSVTKDENQGFIVENDYRQIGIIKSLKEYQFDVLSTAANASACWVIHGDIVSDDIPDDDILKDENNFKFRVIASKISDPVVYAIAKDNVIPNIGESLRDRDGNEYVVIYVNQVSLEVRANSIDKTSPAAGTIITSAGGKKYEVQLVSRPSTSLLVQAIDDISPVPAMTLTGSNNNTFVIRSVTPPTMDKYSGSLIFVNNRMPFSLTSEQTITLKTLIEF